MVGYRLQFVSRTVEQLTLGEEERLVSDERSFAAQLFLGSRQI
jgi:hypothetical protein